MTSLSTARSVALLLTIAFVSRSAHAQVCAGSSPFSNGHVRLGVGVGSIGGGLGSADGNPSLGFQLAAGASRGAFANVGASLASSTKRFLREGFAASGADDALSRTVSANGGYSISSPTLRNVEFCPIAGFALQDGPQMWATCTPLPGGGLSCSNSVQGAARALWFGGNVGRLHQVSPRFAFVPFAGAAVVSSRITGGERSQTDSYVDVSLGAGFIFKRTTIRPTLSVPVGLAGGSTSAALQFAFNIGPKRARESE